MASRSIAPRLHDILDHIAIVRDAVAGRDFQHFLDDPILRLAVERAVEIVSEASRHIPVELQAGHPTVPWRNIKAIGNKLRHEYQRVDPDLIWGHCRRSFARAGTSYLVHPERHRQPA